MHKEGVTSIVWILTSSLPSFSLQNGRGVVWEHELYEPLSYNQDRTFFHTLEGDDFPIAFVFADEGEASELYKKINNRQKYGEALRCGRQKAGVKYG